MTESAAVPIIHVGFVEGFFTNDDVREIIAVDRELRLQYIQLEKFFVECPPSSLEEKLSARASDIFLCIVDMINDRYGLGMPRSPAEFVGE